MNVTNGLNTIPRDVGQLIITKLDLRQITPREAREHAAKWYGVTVAGRTREAVAHNIGKAMAPLRETT